MNNILIKFNQIDENIEILKSIIIGISFLYTPIIIILIDFFILNIGILHSINEIYFVFFSFFFISIIIFFLFLKIQSEYKKLKYYYNRIELGL